MRQFIFFISVSLFLGFAASMAPSQAADKLKVAFNNPGFSDRGFWKDVTDTMQAAAAQFDMEIHVWYGDRDAAKIRENAAKIFQSDIKFDYLLMVNEYQQLSGFLRKAEEKKIPTLFLLNSISAQQEEMIGQPGDKFKFWFGSLVPDNHLAGYEMAQSLFKFGQNKKWQAPYRMLALSGDSRTPASLQRNIGMRTAVSETQFVERFDRFHTNWSKERAYQSTKKMLDSPKLIPQIIWAANDNLGLGAIQAMNEVGLKAGKDYAVAGLNWSKDGLKAVRDKQFTLTHGGHFFAGAWAIILLHDHHNGHVLNKQVNFPMQAITLDNINDFETKLGDRNWSKINFHSFSLTKNQTLKDYDFSLKRLLNAVR